MARLSAVAVVALVLLGGCRNSASIGPGTDGGGNTKLSLTRVEPTSGPTDGGVWMDIWGQNFVAPAKVTLGGVPALQVLTISPLRLAVQTGQSQTAGAVDVNVANGDGQTAQLPGAYTYSNDVNVQLVDCKIQWPPSFYAPFGSSKVVYGHVTGTNLTNTGQQPVGISAQVGYGQKSADFSGWTWTNATYNASCTTCGNVEAEYQANLTAPNTAGTYYYAYRFQYQDAGWMYCDNQPQVNGTGFDWSQAGQMTVGPAQADSVSLCRLQYPTPSNGGTLTGTAGATSPTIYGRVVVHGVTGSGQASPEITAEVGVGPAKSAPTTWSTWVRATYNASCYTGYCSGREEDEYQGPFCLPPPGDYNYTYRFRVGTGAWSYCDQSGMTDGGYTSGLGEILSSGSGGVCQLPDAGTVDAGTVDAGTDAGTDAGVADAGSADGGVCAVTFDVLYSYTSPGQNVYVTGNDPALGTWAPSQAVKLDGTQYPLWVTTSPVNLPQGKALQLKFLVEDSSGNVVTWEPNAPTTSTNREWTVPSTSTATYDGGSWQGTDGGY